jgi:hypothetical protein
MIIFDTDPGTIPGIIIGSPHRKRHMIIPTIVFEEQWVLLVTLIE